jgi:hypothetical protein
MTVDPDGQIDPTLIQVGREVYRPYSPEQPYLLPPSPRE